MLTQTSRSGREPCWNCRDKHLKCDKQEPTCGRCAAKGLDCVVVQKRQIFRQASTANFSNDQHWVNSKPKRARFHIQDTTVPVVSTFQLDPATRHEPNAAGDSFSAQDSHPIIDSFLYSASADAPSQNSDVIQGGVSQLTPESSSTTEPALSHESLQHPPANGFVTHLPSSGLVSSAQATTSHENNVTLEPFESIQEACLLRYFTEEISPWFDICDDRRHFQVVVPQRARHCAPLRNAIFAVSSCHIIRLPQYRTPRGLMYQGQALVDLTNSTPVEYMLKCIPALVDFHKIHDREYQENIMAAAVILRQYEEIEEEEEVDSSTGTRPVNLLAIIQAIIETTVSLPVHYSLANAVFWIAIRQEIYYALARKRFPQMDPDEGKRCGASAANKLVAFAGDVTKWWLGDRSTSEWARLKGQLQLFTTTFKTEFVPILEKQADKSKGEIFPTVWYCTNAQVIGAQHYELARIILIAENPNLRNEPHYREAQRKLESQVRSIVLNICGIGLSHHKLSPSLVNAMISVMLFGEYFTDPRERDALEGIIERIKAIHAWPMKSLHESLRAKWELVDRQEY
ncbi:hypothetical protein BDV25DRAFT_154504 [Aspergillus avenaceus]|uniref:Zn(2)-C6 fungal-type domain-containing protein n=1 Tax=Aspergillus avenaceus TaxID=36643 RepID=A0A5N6TWE5_ASPAV|nr:hypothetical protein BDV25DRAFT_154504 [Aspergillus avenaceus]